MDNRDGLDRLEDGLAASGRISAEFEAELARLRQSMLYAGRETAQLAAGIGGGLRRAFDGLIFDGMKLSDALKGIARSLADTAYSIAMKPVQQALGSVIAQGMNAMLPGGVAQPFADGGVFTQGRVMPFARGGIVTQPTHFPMRGATGLMGEAGPEAIMPLQRGADGRLGVAASATAAPRPISVTVNVTTPDVAGFSRSQSQIAAHMRRALARGDRNS